MAQVFLAPAPIGDDSRSYVQAQNIGTPWATPEKPIASAVSGDLVSMVPGTYLVSAFLNISILLDYFTSSGRAVWTKGSSNSFIARSSSSAPSGTIRIANTDLEGADGVTQCFEAGDTVLGVALVFDEVGFNDGIGSGFFSSSNRGSATFNNCSVRGSVTTGINATSSLGTTEAYSLTINGLTLDQTAGAPSSIFGVSLTRSSTATFPVNVNIGGVDGSITADPGAACKAIFLDGIESAVVNGGRTFTVNSTNTGVESHGVHITGKDAVANADNALISDITVNFNAPSGHAAILGESTAASFMAGGTISGVTVNGKFFASSTPHGLTLGNGTTGATTNCTVNNEYAAFLISQTTTANVSGNTATNPYGVGFYAKGTTAATIDNCTVTIDGGQVQRELGLLTAIFQGAVDCTAATFSNNTILVADIAAINSLAMISQLAADPLNAQPVTFTNNNYIIPDTVDLDNELLFTRLGVSGQAANQTFSQWLANSEVTGDTITQLPANQILGLIGGSSPVILSPYPDLSNNIGDSGSIDLSTNVTDGDEFPAFNLPIGATQVGVTAIVNFDFTGVNDQSSLVTVSPGNPYGRVQGTFNWKVGNTASSINKINKR